MVIHPIYGIIIFAALFLYFYEDLVGLIPRLRTSPVKKLGIFVMLAGIACGCAAFFLNGESDFEKKQLAIAASVEENVKNLRAVRDVAVAFSASRGDHADTAASDSKIADSKELVMNLRDEMKQYADNRQSNQLIMLVIAGFLILTGAVLIK